MEALALLFRPSDDAAGRELLSPEVVEDQFAVLARGADDFLHRLDARAHPHSVGVSEEELIYSVIRQPGRPTAGRPLRPACFLSR
jgi:hypothetical protein